PRVLVVNQVFAERHWPGQDPIGKRLHVGGTDGALAEVVGVARTHRYLWSGEAPMEMIYQPFAQSQKRRMTMLLATDGPSAALAGPLREAVRAFSPDLPVHDVRSIEDHWQQRAVSVSNLLIRSVACMGALGLGLALVGLYGVVAYSASKRTREIGIRVAIGA